MDNEQLKPQSEWYLQFKNIYQQMKFDEKQSVFTLNELKFKELKQLLLITVHLVEGGIDFVINKQIDQRLWKVIKSIIEALDKVNFIGPNKVDELKEFYNSIIDLLKQIIKSSTIKVTDLNRDNKHRLFCANLYCYVGEIYEFMEKQLLRENISNPKNFNIAVALYDKALQFYPYEGKYNYLKSSLMIQFQDTFAATYYLLRSLMSQNAFNCKEKLNEVYEMNKVIYVKWAKNLRKSPEVTRDQYMQAFMVYLIKFNSIIYTKIGFDELEQLSGMFELLKEYLQIVRTNVQTDHKNQAEILIKIIQITNFGLHYCFHGGKQVLKCNQDILDNDLVRESIKYVYGIYSNILDFVLKYLIQSSTKNVDEIVQSTYLQVVIPILYYLYDQPLICQHLLTNFNDLNNILSQVYYFARSNLQRVESQSEQDLFKVQEQINEQFHNYLFSFEMPLVGLTLYQHVLKTLKKNYKIIDGLSEDQQTTNLFYVSERIIQELSGIKIVAPQEIRIPEQTQNIILQKRLVILDGMNVALRFGQECRNEQKFYSKGIQVAFDYWFKRGHEVLIVLPDFCFNENDLEKKKNSNKNINKLPDDVQLLQKFKQKGYAFGVPNWSYDDSYMIEYGRNKNAFIMTNDRYNDHIKTSNIVEREKFKEWIRNNCISFTFIQEELVPDPDFLKRM